VCGSFHCCTGLEYSPTQACGRGLVQQAMTDRSNCVCMCVCVSFHCCTGLDCSPTQACGIGAGTAGQDKLASTFLRATIFIRCCVGLERSPKQACGIGAGAAGQDKLTKHIFEGYHLHSLLRRPGALPQRGLWHWGWCSRLSLAYKESKLGQSLWQKRTPLLLTCFFRYNECQRCVCV